MYNNFNTQNYYYSPRHLKMPCHRAIKLWPLKLILPRRPITQPWSSKVEPSPELGPKSNRALSLKLIMEEISSNIMAVTIKISIIIFNLLHWFQVCRLFILGVKVRIMKMDFNTGGTWRRVAQWTLMTNDENLLFFFCSAKSFSCLV